MTKKFNYKPLIEYTNYEGKKYVKPEKAGDLKEDMENILLMIDVLEDDYLGGHGTRGYGRIKFKDFSIDIKTYTEENDKEIVAIKKEIDNFRKELESKVE